METARWRRFALPLLLLSLAALSAAAEEKRPKEPAKDPGKAESELKQAGQEFVEDAKAVGRDIRKSKVAEYVEEGARELGRDTAEVSRQGWGKTKSLSSSATEEVKRATREFWDDVIRTKQAAAEKLRKENADLKSSKPGEAAPRSEPAKEVP